MIHCCETLLLEGPKTTTTTFLTLNNKYQPRYLSSVLFSLLFSLLFFFIYQFIFACPLFNLNNAFF